MHALGKSNIHLIVLKRQLKSRTKLPIAIHLFIAKA